MSQNVPQVERLVAVSTEQFTDLQELYSRLLNGTFYKDHDEDARLVVVLRHVLADAMIPGMFKTLPLYEDADEDVPADAETRQIMADEAKSVQGGNWDKDANN